MILRDFMKLLEKLVAETGEMTIIEKGESCVGDFSWSLLCPQTYVLLPRTSVEEVACFAEIFRRCINLKFSKYTR